ncbi:MAG: hypothetical protein PSV36_17840 [Algoriphagus sp.]|nr:hypothetical protein [Algoriphagus sp.]
MLIALQLFFQILLGLSLFCLIAGLFKPVLVLWFLDRFNRFKVIQIYGLVSLILTAFILILELIIDFL